MKEGGLCGELLYVVDILRNHSYQAGHRVPCEWINKADCSVAVAHWACISPQWICSPLVLPLFGETDTCATYATVT